MSEHIAYIGLGSNLQNPLNQLRSAFAAIDQLPETQLLARSSLYRSSPIGLSGADEQPDFLNAVAKIKTALTPQALLHELLHIEHRHGRERTFRNAPRTLDMDVLLYDNLQLHEHGLTIPHPRMHQRAFVLQPLLEIAPDIVIPGAGRAQQSLQACREQVVEKIADDGL